MNYVEKKELMLKSIHKKQLVKVKFNSKEKGIIERTCVPFDIGISRKYRSSDEWFHYYDLNSPSGEHNLPILPENLIEINILETGFDPKDYVYWKPNWFVSRNWGEFS
jgi:hypothetical protein